MLYKYHICMCAVENVNSALQGGEYMNTKFLNSATKNARF